MGSQPGVTPLPLQRPSPDRRTVVVETLWALQELLLLTRNTGWSVLWAQRQADAIRVVLARA